MTAPSYSLGLDFGTNTVRALLVDVANGSELGTGVAPYPHGEAGIITDPKDPHLARQHPADYETALVEAVKRCLEEASHHPGFDRRRVVAVGIDATASTPMPVDSRGRPLALDERFAENPNAMAWLWKDHTSHAEAEEITELARKECPEHLERSGGECSSEWFFSKLLRCQRAAPQVLEAAAAWVELGDYVAGMLVGSAAPDSLKRNTCAAGHKALYHERHGLPGVDFFRKLSPELGAWCEGRLYAETLPASARAGGLCREWAERLELTEGTAVAVAAIDAHVGAVGAGIRPGALVKILGTSSCDMLVHPASDEPLANIPGLCGIVRDSILPGYWGLEAGQVAVGDIFAWFVREFGLPAGLSHAELTRRASELEPGESGLLCLDWNNGNRSLLNDPLLSGLLVGQTLSTRPHEVYRALIEGTAFGARMIVDRIVEYGVPVDEVVFCGGIAEKNPMLLEIYADILDRPLKISRSEQTCALGAAIFGAVAAGPEVTGLRTVDEAQSGMTGLKDACYGPEKRRVSVYAEIKELYRALHDAFGRGESSSALGAVMKKLLEIKSRHRH